MRRVQTTLAAYPIALLLAAYIALGLVYSNTIPLFESFDEVWHFAFVQHVATGKGLPVQAYSKRSHLAQQEGSQPPLYYLVAAGATAWIDTSDFPHISSQNPHFDFNLPWILNDNKNRSIHTAAENFPYHGTALAVHIARLVSIAFGALGVLFSYFLLNELFPQRGWLALSGASLVAFVPEYLAVSSSVSNDSAIVALSALSLWLAVRLLRTGPTPRRVALVGAAAGLAALAKASGLALVPLLALVLLWKEWNSWKKLAQHLSILSATFALTAGWWYLRNLFLYGELTGTTMMLRIFGGLQKPLTFSQAWSLMPQEWESVWIALGLGNIRAVPLVYNAFSLAVLLAVTGLVIGAVRHRAELIRSRAKLMPFAVLLLWGVIILAGVYYWIIISIGPHGRLLLPAMPALLTLIIIGLVQWVPPRFQPVIAGAAVGALGVLAALVPALIITPAYALPPAARADDPAIQHRVDLNYENRVKLLGYSVSRSPVTPNRAIILDLYWQSLAPMERNYTIGIHLLDGNLQVIGARNSYPGHGTLPTTQWTVGQVFRDTYYVPINRESKAVGTGQIKVALFDEANDNNELTAYDGNGLAVTPFIGRFKIPSASRPPAQPQNQLQSTFAGQIALEGYDIQAGQELRLTLYWHRLMPLNTDYTVFVHVLDADGRIIAQKDAQPQGGNNPTSFWAEGEQVRDAYQFDLPAEAGARQMSIGLYRPDTGERLGVTDAQGRPIGDHITLPVGGK